VVDGAEPRPALSTAPGRALVLLTKVDLYRERPLPDWLPKDSLAVSAETGAGLASLLDRIRAELSVAEPGEHAVLTRIRHRRGLEAAATALRAFLAGTEDQPELGAEDLRRATHALGRITGRVDVEDVLEALFAAFCIGK
jgi:tRNA modification GTPase